MFDIITFGSATVDVFLETGLREKGKFMTYPVGEKIILEDMKFDVGGGGTNTAVAFSRLGLKVGYLGKVDSGFSGKQILKVLKKEKVRFLGKVEKDQNKLGGYSIVLDSKEKDRTILSYKGVNDEIDLFELNIKNLKTKWFYMSSFLGKSFETQKKFAKLFYEKGVKIAFNPSDYLIKEKNLSEILKITEILILNKEEAKLLTKEKDILFGLKKLGPKMIVVTDGSKRVQFYDGKNKFSVVPPKVKVLEETGAGDAFASGFVAGQIVGMSAKDSLKLALEEGASVVTHFGAKNNLIRRKLK